MGKDDLPERMGSLAPRKRKVTCWLDCPEKGRPGGCLDERDAERCRVFRANRHRLRL